MGWNEDNQVFGGVLHHTLAAQAGVDARIYGAVDKVLLFIADFGQAFLAAHHIHVAGATTTHAPTIVLELNAIVESYVQHRLAFSGHVGLLGLAVLKLEGDIDSFHEEIFRLDEN